LPTYKKIPVIRKYKDTLSQFLYKKRVLVSTRQKKSASTHFLTAGNVENAPCGQIKKKTADPVVSYCDNMVGTKKKNKLYFV